MSIRACIAFLASAFACVLPASGQACTSQDNSASNASIGFALVDGLNFYPDQFSNGSPVFSAPMQQKLNIISSGSDRIRVRTVPDSAEEAPKCGWVPKVFVKQGADPLTVAEASRNSKNKSQLIDGRVIQNPLDLKGLLKSLPSDTSFDPLSVKVYSAPSENASQRATLGVFGIFRIFATYRSSNAPTAEPDWFFIANENPLRPVSWSGWVKSSNVFTWESQMSIYFNSANTSPADIFVSYDAMLTGNKKGLIAQKPSSDTSPPSRNIARFPILSEVQRPGQSANSNIHYRIGFFGDACAANRSACVSGAQAIDDSSTVFEAAEMMKKTQVLFVIDNTLSMTSYYGPIANAVSETAREIETKLRQQNEPDTYVQFAAAVYGDYRSASNPSIDNMDFRFVGNNSFSDYRTLAGLKSLSYFQDALYDKPESPYGGLARALRDVRWSPDAGARILIWIGDHGGRNYGNTEPITSEIIRKQLAAKKVVLIPINVRGAYDGSWNGRFIQQANDIRNGSSSSTVKPQVAKPVETYRGSTADVSRTAAEVRQAILGVFYGAGATIALVENRGASESGVQTKIASDIARAQLVDLGSVDSAIKDGPLAYLNLSRDQIRQIFEKKQVMAPGFVSYSPTNENFTFWVNLNRGQLGTLQLVMRGACDGFDGGDPGDRIESALLTVTNIMGGDKYRPDEKVGDFLLRRFFIPSRYLPSVLNNTTREIEDEWRRAGNDAAKREKIVTPICRSAYLLELVSRNQKVKNLRRLSSKRTGFDWSTTSDNLTTFEWGWNNDVKDEYLYVPVEYFPSDIK
ncbi:MAG: hypothetical protein KDA53_00645 [Hyphomonas sp.]|nr:hypothetical protein [Hyphomonas sp.]